MVAAPRSEAPLGSCSRKKGFTRAATASAFSIGAAWPARGIR